MAYRNSSTSPAGLASRTRLEQVCIRFPPKVSSPGIYQFIGSNKRKEEFLDYAGPRLQYQMILTSALTLIIHNILKYLGLPIFISQILAGVVLGPMVYSDKNSLITMSEDSVKVLGTVSSLGYIFFLFLTGVKMDLSMTYKAGRKAICIGLLTVLVPLTFCLLTVQALGTDLGIFKSKCFFLAVTYCGTSFPVIHLLLSDLKILNSELGRLGLSAALVSDIFSMVLLMLGQWVQEAQEKSAKTVVEGVAMAALLVFVIACVLRPAMKLMVKRTGPEGGQIKPEFLYAIILLFLSSPRITEFHRMFILHGPFILGLGVPDGPPLGSTLVDKFEPTVSGLFLPLFASTCGMRINLSTLNKSSKFAQKQVIVAVVAVIVKFGVSLALPLLCKMPMRDSLALAFIMIAKGIVEMGSYSFMSDNALISRDLLGFMSIKVVLLAIIVPLSVKRLYDPSRRYIGYQRRDIMHSKLNEDLRIISCIHVPSNVSSTINVLNASCPTKESPIALDVIHLVKLSGRATPIFIAHQKHKKTWSSESYSENVVLAFNQFERENWEAVSVNVFTAVSPTSLMYEDVCNLALDKLTSFIILPFHRRWNIDGSIESEDQAIRTLNCSMLERAPCSVGILVEGRRHLKRSNSRDSLTSALSMSSSSYNIAVIFLGGEDDREALALAKRISLEQRVSLTVIRLKATDSLAAILADCDRMLDDEMLRSVKESGYVRYVEKLVNDGPETSSFLRAIVDEYQLIIVGRRYNKEDSRTLGLEEWSEFEEIGIIGDLLSSEDFGGNYSLLIVQQQRLRT